MSRLCAFLAIFVLAAVPAGAATIIHAGQVIDGIADQPAAEQSIIVVDGKIARIEAGYTQPGDGDEVIDLRGHTVLPGLMDLHTHLTNESSPQSYSEWPRLHQGMYAIRATVYAERTLMAGFTTVRDVGDRFNISVPLRNSIAQGLVPGPRIFTAATSIASTGGHGDRSSGMRSDFAGDPGPREGVVNSPGDARKAVRQRYKDGANLIKITATGGVLSMAKNSQNPQFSEEELRAIVETATDYGFHVAAHAHGAEGMKRAVRAGVRTIEHGTLMDEETMQLMVEKGAYLVPTLMAGEHVANKAKIDGYYPEMIRPKAAAIGPKMQATMTRALKAGVKIAFGTDCGVSPHGTNAREFVLMVQAGMTPMQAIRSATVVAAEVLDMQDELGSLEAGKIADIVAVEKNPLDDISVLGNVGFVMKEGVIYKR